MYEKFHIIHNGTYDTQVSQIHDTLTDSVTLHSALLE